MNIYKHDQIWIFMETYEKLLEEAYSKIKKAEGNLERFEIPKVEGHFEGKKTIITNFSQIVSIFRRNPSISNNRW